jgi:hypothetical protein
MSSQFEQSASFLRDHAEDAMRTARETASRIHGSAVQLADTTLDYTPGTHSIGEPPKFSDLFAGADNTSAEVVRLNGEVDKWIDKYFPEMNGPLRSSPEKWAQGIISGSDPYGDSRAVIDALWHEARDRARRDTGSTSRTLEAAFSERGFRLPPGALVRLTAESAREASQAAANVNRSETVKMAEIKVDLIKFAEETAVRLKLGVMDSLRAFYMAWISLPDKDIERARVHAQAQASLYGALSSYHNVEIGFEQLRLKAAEAKTQAAINNDRNKIAASTSSQSATALAGAVRGFSDISAAAANAQSSLVAEITSGA